jgi:glc operon protein GlcG
MLKPLLPLALAVLLSSDAVAQQPPAPYGPPIKLEHAKKVLAAAQAEARKNNWNVVITIVDSAGFPVVMERMDDTQLGSVEVAQSKARSAVLFRRPTKAFQDVVAMGGDGLRILKLEGAVPNEGGIPLILDGKIIGGIGVSGVTSQQDGVIAAAGVAALKP